MIKLQLEWREVLWWMQGGMGEMTMAEEKKPTGASIIEVCNLYVKPE